MHHIASFITFTVMVQMTIMKSKFHVLTDLI